MFEGDQNIFKHTNLHIICSNFPAEIKKKRAKLDKHYKWVNEARRTYDAAREERNAYKGQTKKVMQTLVRQELNTTTAGKAVLGRVDELKASLMGNLKALPVSRLNGH